MAMIWLLMLLLIGIPIALVIFRVNYRKKAGVCTCPIKLTGKTVLITGATAGIGKETAKDLANRGARLILACRNLEKAQKTKDWVVSLTGNQNVIVRHLDVSDLDSVRKFCKETLDKEDRLDVLINNAGIYMQYRHQSKQGKELTMATNHFGPFLLTNLLLDLIKKSAPSRIINVSSAAHKSFHLDFEDVHFKKRQYNGFSAYAQSKLCNILFTKELAHHQCGEGVTVNALHPGAVDTEIPNREKTFQGAFLSVIMKIVGKTPSLGAQTTIHLAVSDEGGQITGEYFVDCKVAETSKKALDPGLAKKLWELSEDEVGLSKE